MKNIQKFEGSIQDVAEKTGQSIAETMMGASHIVIIDASGSMEEDCGYGLGNWDREYQRVGKSKWEAALEELAKLQKAHPGKLAIVVYKPGRSTEVREHRRWHGHQDYPYL
jgi:hypothetical protein